MSRRPPYSATVRPTNSQGHHELLINGHIRTLDDFNSMMNYLNQIRVLFKAVPPVPIQSAVQMVDPAGERFTNDPGLDEDVDLGPGFNLDATSKPQRRTRSAAKAADPNDISHADFGDNLPEAAPMDEPSEPIAIEID